MPRTLAFAFLLFAAPPAAAQTPGPALPMGMDIRKAAVGTWSEYTIKMAEIPPIKQRFALVGRDAETHTLEVISEGGAIGPQNKAVVKMILEADPTKKDRLRKLITQIADNDPMEMPNPPGAHKDQFRPPNPKKLVGTQKVNVAAGTFTAKHYRDKLAGGDVMDVWVSDEAPPLGIVKMQGTFTQGATESRYAFTMELGARGKDAKAIITKTPQPFDQGVMMGQMKRAVENAGKGK